MRENMHKYVAKASIPGKQKRSLSCRGKALFSCGLIAALLFLPQAVWAEIPEGTASGQNAIAIGVDSKATADNSIALGYNSVASEAYTVSVGGNDTTRRIVNVADGTADSDAATVGQLNSGVTALGDAVAGIIGTNIGYDGENFSGAINIGGTDYYTVEAALNALYNGTAGSTGGAVGGDEIVIDPSKGAVTIAEGGNIQITQDAAAPNKFTVGVSPTPTFTSVSADSATVGGITMGNGGISLGGKQITGLADGNITMGSTDAVTGGQLFEYVENITGEVDAIDERVEKTEAAISQIDGDVDKLKNDIGDLDGRVTKTEEAIGTIDENVNKIIDGIATGDIDIITGNSTAVKYDDSSKTHITLNEGGEATQLTNVADGRIAAGSRDAVTGNQLYQAYQRMNDLDRSIDVVGAHAAAMSALHPVPYNKYEPTTFSAGVGTYHDEYAMAIGAFHYLRPNLMVNVGASVCSDGDVMGRIGLSIALGKSTKKQPELAHDVAGMQEQMSVMQAKLTELEEQNRRDKEIIQKNAEIMAQNERIIRELMQKSENK